MLKVWTDLGIEFTAFELDELEVTEPSTLVAVITRDAAEELDLRPGMSASAIVKSTSVMVER